MTATTFSVFLDTDVSPQATPKPTTSSSRKTSRGLHDAMTKENINPLTGLSFDSQPPLKKRKPSSSSTLRVKSLPSSSKVKSKKTGNGKKRTVLGCNANRPGVDVIEDNDVETLFTALANRRAFECTVMPLADVTQAYDESEVDRPGIPAARHEATEKMMSLDATPIIEAIPKEFNDVEMSNITSKEETLCTNA